MTDKRGVDLEELGRAHREHKAWPLMRGDPRAAEDGYIHKCRADGKPWPCDVSRLLAIAEAARDLADLAATGWTTGSEQAAWTALREALDHAD